MRLMNKCLGCLLFLFLSGVVLGQDKVNTQWQSLKDSIEVYSRAENYEKALTFAEQLATYAKTDSLQTVYLNTKINLLQNVGEYGNLDSLYNILKGLTKEVYGDTSLQYLLISEDYAYLYTNWGEYDKAELIYNEIIKIYEVTEKEKGNYANALVQMALLYRKTGRYEDAEMLYLQAIDIKTKLFGANNSSVAITLNNLAALYVQMRAYAKAVAILKKVLSVYANLLGEDHINCGILANNIASAYLKIGDYEHAEMYFNKVKKNYQKNIGTYNHKYAGLINNLAYLAKEQGDYDKARKLYEEAIEIYKIVLGPNNILIAFRLNNLADVYLELDSLDKAQELLIQAIVINCKTALDTADVIENLTEIVASSSFKEPLTLISTLLVLERGLMKKYKQTSDLEALMKTFELGKISVSYIYRAQQSLINKKNKQYILEYMSTAVVNATDVAQKLNEATKELGYLKAILGFIDYNKSAVLSSALQSSDALNFGEVPDSLVQKEQMLAEEADELEKEKIKATNTKDSAILRAVRAKIIDLNLKQDGLLKHLKKTYPKYSKLRYEQQELDVDAVQKELLDEQTALLEYFVYDTTVYLIVLTAKEIQLHLSTFKKGELAKEIGAFRKSLSDYVFITGNPDKAYSTYSNTAYYFYKKLIEPAKLDGIKKLIIVPDDLLSHIPFETLLQIKPQEQDGNYASLAYLIKDYTISYSYSTELLLENKKQRKNTNNGQLLAMGAMYSATDSSIAKSRSPLQQQLRKILSPLPSIKQEIEKLESLYGTGQFLYGKEATEASFKQIASDYAIIHLAMHGLLNEHHPLISSLAFTENGDSLEDNFLEAHEISHLQLNSDLVVLSACETGYGKFEQGEGVMSLARSFMYAGVPSLVVSLWQVNDKATAMLMENFYNNLYTGMAKNDALQKAKLDYISNVKGIGGHPAFWSPFIQLGNTDSIEIEKSKTWIWWALGGLGLLIVVFFGRKWMKKSELV